METPKNPSERLSETWLIAVRDRLSDIEEVAKKADPAYQPIVFGRLLEVVIQDARVTRQPAKTEPPASGGAPSPTVTPDAGNGRFAQFLRDYGISLETLANVIDLDSGVVLTRNLGTTKAEKTRRIAALLALVNARKSGAFIVGREELVRVCEENAAYDIANFARHMKGVEFNGAVVFTPEGDGYKVSRPGEAFIADVIKGAMSAAGAP